MYFHDAASASAAGRRARAGVRHAPFLDRLDVVQVKYEMLRQIDGEGQPITASAAAFGFSRPTFYRRRRRSSGRGCPLPAAPEAGPAARPQAGRRSAGLCPDAPRRGRRGARAIVRQGQARFRRAGPSAQHRARAAAGKKPR